MAGVSTTLERGSLAFTLLTLVASCAPADTSDGHVTGGGVAIAVAPLDLPQVGDATWRLTVAGTAGQVWTRELSSDAYGDGAGSLAYVGTCDAEANPNTVTLELLELRSGSGATLPTSDYKNPGALTRDFVCQPDADVAVAFDVTVARRAEQGFFDVAVGFEDVFCSAKLDCLDDDGGPLELLSAPGGDRAQTVVAGLSCVAGGGETTTLLMDRWIFTCDDGTYVSHDPSAGPGNVGAGVSPYLFQRAVFRGETGFGSEQGCYWNQAFGLDLDAIPAGVSCTLSGRATATSAAWPDGATPDGWVWPVITWSVPVVSDGALACGRHAVDVAGSGVATGYVGPASEAFSYSATCDAPAVAFHGHLCEGPINGIPCPSDDNPCTVDACNPSTGTCGQVMTSGTGSVVIQPGPADQLDKYVGSVYDSDPNGTATHLKVGGWGDQYWTHIRFDLAGLPAGATAATLALYCNPDSYNPPAMWLDRVDGPWTLTTTWGQRPPGTQLRGVPAATIDSPYSLDVLDLVTAWVTGAATNYGLRLRPQSSNHQTARFWSADYTVDPSLRPALQVDYDCAAWAWPCQDTDVCTPECEGTPCDDGDACTSGDTCSGGACVATGGCDDGDPCTSDTCAGDGSGCEHVFTCVTMAAGSVAFESVPALDDAGQLIVSGRTVPVASNRGRTYALRSSDLGVNWGPITLTSGCTSSGSPLAVVDDTQGVFLTYGDWNWGSSNECAKLRAKRLSDAAAVWTGADPGPHPRHDPALSATHAYFGGYNGQEWTFALSNGARGASMNLGTGTSNAGGLVLMSNDDMIASMTNSKTERWSPSGSRVWTSTALAPSRLYMTSGDNVVGWATSSDAIICASGANGQQLWTAAVTPVSAGIPSAILTDAAGDIYLGDGAGAVALTAAGQVRWATDLGGDAYAQLLGDDGRVYVRTAGTLYAIDRVDGSVAWSLDAVATDGFSGTWALLADGDLFATDLDGTTYRLATSGLDYADAPWSRPRGNRRNSAKVGDHVALP